MFHGACCFRQEYDHMTKRSFNQKTLVLLSTHDFTPLYLKLLASLSSSGSLTDPARLEGACSEIASWPSPVVGSQRLNFLGNVLDFEM